MANKIDEVRTEKVYEELRGKVLGVPIFPVCVVLAEGILELKASFKILVNGEDSSILKYMTD